MPSRPKLKVVGSGTLCVVQDDEELATEDDYGFFVGVFGYGWTDPALTFSLSGNGFCVTQIDFGYPVAPLFSIRFVFRYLAFVDVEGYRLATGTPSDSKAMDSDVATVAGLLLILKVRARMR